MTTNPVPHDDEKHTPVTRLLKLQPAEDATLTAYIAFRGESGYDEINSLIKGLMAKDQAFMTWLARNPGAKQASRPKKTAGRKALGPTAIPAQPVAVAR